MTSKTLFLKLSRDDFKRKLWIFICISLFALFMKPIYTLMQIDTWLGSDIPVSRIMDYVVDSVSFDGSNSILAPLLAVILGIVSFSWLFFERKTDMMHALPLKREKLFIYHYLNGFILFFVPMTIASLLQIATISAKGFYSSAMIEAALSTYLYNILYFFIYYHVTILAVMLTGNILVCIAAAGVFIFYSPVIWWLIDTYYSSFMSTFYRRYDYSASFLRSLTSPLLSQFYVSGSGVHKILMIACSFLISLILLFLALYLYKKRKSECAEKPLAFPKTAPFIRIAIVIPAALIGGMYIRMMSTDLSHVWFWFTFICAGILAHCVMEIIFQLDFKAALGHKLQLVFSIAFTALIVLSFQYDWFSYDGYLPQKEDVASASIHFYTIDSNRNYMGVSDSESGTHITYVNNPDYSFDNMNLSDIDTVLSLAKTGIAETDQFNYTDTSYRVGLFSSSGSHAAIPLANRQELPTVSFVICYKLTSGQEVYRTYEAFLTDAYADIEKIYDSKEYRSATSQFDDFKKPGVLKNVSFEDVWGDTVLSLNGDQMEEFISAYEKDMAELTFDTINKELPILSLTFQSTSYMAVSGYYIYPSFGNSMKLLESYQLGLDTLTSSLDPVNIQVIVASRYNEDTEEATVDYVEYSTSNTEDASKILDLSSKMHLYAFSYVNPSFRCATGNYDFQITYKKSNGVTTTSNAFILETDIPDFLITDLNAAAGISEK